MYGKDKQVTSGPEVARSEPSVIEKLNNCVSEACRYNDRLERLRNIMGRAGMVNLQPEGLERPEGERSSFSLNEIALQLPGTLNESNNDFGDLLDILERQLVG